jgi:hypothetical protein
MRDMPVMRVNGSSQEMLKSARTSIKNRHSAGHNGMPVLALYIRKVEIAHMQRFFY